MLSFKDLELLPVPDSAAQAVADLVARYHRHRDLYRGANYNEAQLRQEFLNPFFAALGWDMDNRRGHAAPYKEVVHEDTLRVGDTARAPDYCFRLMGQPKFYVEAKAPSINIKGAPAPAYQLRRYGWSAKLPLSVLTDFEEFAIYDCREKPAPTDPAAYARVGYFTYDQYGDHLAELYSIFAYEAIPKGFFDRYAEAGRGKRGTTSVDAAFLAEIERWRDELARNIALRNETSVADLNFAVQAIIDRILFLRIAEDRGIEPEKRLQTTAAGHNLYPLLCDLFHEADSKYNSGLFDFTTSKGDRLTTGLHVDDKVLKDLIADLYYPRSPYEFSVIGADILGAVYEQFLGKVIRLTKGGYAKVEEKPEVKKAGGVYYTPRYIVDYIVEHTVGAALGEGAVVVPPPFREGAGGRTPLRSSTPENGNGVLPPPFDCAQADPSLKGGANGVLPPPFDCAQADPSLKGGVKGSGPTPAEVAQLRILDPACGSGSFLLGAYERLLRWHLEYYLAHEPEKQLRARHPKLAQTPQGDWKLSIAERKRILQAHIYGVDIDPQAVEVAKLNLLLKCLEGETEQTLKAQRQLFATERVLPNIDGNIKCGNSLIGPDYFTGRLDMHGPEYDEEYRRVNPFDWEKQFPEIMKAGGFDCVIGNPPYIQFSMEEYADGGVNEYLRKTYSSSMARLNTFGLFIERVLRRCLGENGLFSFIVPNTLLTQEYYQPLRLLMMQYAIESLTSFSEMVFSGAVVETTVFVVRGRSRADNNVELVDYDNRTHAAQTRSVPQALFAGTHHNAFVVLADQRLIALLQRLSDHYPTLSAVANINQAIALKHDRAASLDQKRKASNYKPVLDGRDIQRYALLWPGTYLAYDVGNIHSCKRTDIFEAAQKILFRRVGDRLIATLDTQQHYALNTLVVITWRDPGTTDLRYLLGLFNSRLLNECYTKVLKSTKRVFSEIQARQVGQLPIRAIDFSNPAEVAQHDRMVGLVQTMLDLHRRLPEAANPKTRDLLTRQIEDTDRALDRLVYELYDLTEEEIAIVEGEEGKG